MDINPPHSLRRSFELHLRAENRALNAIADYLESIRQAETFLASRGKTLQDAHRADLEAFMADLLTRRSASTAATLVLVEQVHHVTCRRSGKRRSRARRPIRDQLNPGPMLFRW
jgi:hypothetical protein